MQSFGWETHTYRTIWWHRHRDNNSLGWVNLAQSKHLWEAILGVLMNLISIQFHAMTKYNIQQDAQHLKPQSALKYSAFCWILYFSSRKWIFGLNKVHGIWSAHEINHFSITTNSRHVNHLTPNVNYTWRTAPLTSKVAFYIFIQQI